MTMQVFKYCWPSKDFLSKWQKHYSTVKVTGWASSAKCKIKCDLKREIQLLVSSRCSMCVHMHHTCREFSSGPFGFMFKTHERLPHNLSTQPATSSNIPTCWIHRGSSNQWGSTPTGMDTATQGGSASRPPPKLPEVSETLAARHLYGAVYQHSNTVAGGLPFAVTACTSGGLLPKLFFHCAPGCCGYPWTHTSPVQTPSNPTAIQCTTAVSVAQMLRRQRTAEFLIPLVFLWFSFLHLPPLISPHSSAPPPSTPLIFKILSPPLSFCTSFSA